MKKYIEVSEDLGCKHCLARAYLLKGEFAKGIAQKETLEEARMIAREIFLPDTLFHIYLFLTEYYLEKKYISRAFGYCQKAVELLKDMVSLIDDHNLQEKFIAEESRSKIFKIIESLKKIS